MGEVNNDESNFILTAIQPYWNELAMSVQLLAEQLFIKKKKSAALLTVLAEAKGPNNKWYQAFPLILGDIFHCSGCFARLVAVICVAVPIWQKM